MRRKREYQVFDDTVRMLHKNITSLPWYFNFGLAIVSYFLFHLLSLRYPIVVNHAPWEFVFAVFFFITQFFLTGIFIFGGIASAFYTINNTPKDKESVNDTQN